MRFSELEDKSIGVWGAGREIRSFAAQLNRRIPSARIAVVASDDPASPDAREELAAADARIAFGEEIVAALGACDVVVRSPGVSMHREELRELRSRGVPVTTATALWLAEVGGDGVIGVTGTKGKSTTAALIAHLARAAGRSVELAGNIGVPALDQLDRPAAELTVVELSSYQIADLETGPEVAVVTNLHREHLDWHGTEERYHEDKLRLLGLPGVRATVLNGRDERLVPAARAAVGVRLFGVPQAWDVTAGGIAFDGCLAASTDELPLRGAHNALNLCAALTAIEAIGIPRQALPEALAGVAALPHRLEIVREGDGVTWVDDSISTTPESTLAALASFPESEIVLLGGGQDREQDYAALGRVLAERGAVVLGLPDTGARLIAAAREAGAPAAKLIVVEDMDSAVGRARKLARAGTTVLLSPAAPSYNAYRNFEERAEDFRAALERAVG
ncbi:MAG: UDP-N-acetylmuramoyl-L-alanine--D-glutamate ligase [Solirubrobacterales bacterium]